MENNYLYKDSFDTLFTCTIFTIIATLILLNIILNVLYIKI